MALYILVFVVAFLMMGAMFVVAEQGGELSLNRLAFMLIVAAIPFINAIAVLVSLVVILLELSDDSFELGKRVVFRLKRR